MTALSEFRGRQIRAMTVDELLQFFDALSLEYLGCHRPKAALVDRLLKVHRRLWVLGQSDPSLEVPVLPER